MEWELGGHKKKENWVLGWATIVLRFGAWNGREIRGRWNLGFSKYFLGLGGVGTWRFWVSRILFEGFGCGMAWGPRV